MFLKVPFPSLPGHKCLEERSSGRFLILLGWQQLQARIGIDHDRHGHQLKALNAG
jgi:hypothetical protein